MKKISILIGLISLMLISNQIPVQAATIETAKDTLIKATVTTGDGLYKDEYEKGRYIYKGEKPNNYLTFNDETAGWRILSVEQDGTIKIIKNQSIGNMIFDYEDDGTYCKNNGEGCNAWSATNNMIGQPEIFQFKYDENIHGITTITVSGNILEDSDINKYLNNTYYDTMTNKAKNNIEKHIFYIGGTKEENTEKMIQNEKEFQWEGNIGLINYTDFLRTINNNKTWIKRGYTLTPKKAQFSLYLTTTEEYYWYDAYTKNNIDVYPVVYLKANSSLNGSGTPNDPYTIADVIEIKFETFGDYKKNILYRLDTTGETLEEIKNDINNQIGTKIEENGKCCTLDSWYLDKNLKTRFDEDTPINSNLTLYGKWSCADVVNVPNTSIYIQKWILITGICITIIGIIIIGLVIKKKKQGV